MFFLSLFSSSFFAGGTGKEVQLCFYLCQNKEDLLTYSGQVVRYNLESIFGKQRLIKLAESVSELELIATIPFILLDMLLSPNSFRSKSRICRLR